MRGTHKHKCPLCGFVWRHSDKMQGNTEAHTCPCGGQSWSWYEGDQRADVVMCNAPQYPKRGRFKNMTPAARVAVAAAVSSVDCYCYT